MIVHPIPPCFDKESRILILGSFPSVKSRESGFFYGHPQNRFWKVLAAIFEEEVPTSIPEKKAFLSRCHVALWDVLHSCEIKGSADSSIKNAVPNDLSVILEAAPIEKIFVNGKTAEKIYIRFLEPVVGRKAVLLPSTSPANASWRLEELVKEWRAAIMER